jgi:hypothetical protein
MQATNLPSVLSKFGVDLKYFQLIGQIPLVQQTATASSRIRCQVFLQGTEFSASIYAAASASTFSDDSSMLNSVEI